MPEPEIFSKLNMEVHRGPDTFYHGGGCDRCKQRGYLGRAAILEVLPVSEAIRRLIIKRASAAVLKNQALSEGMKSLRLAGIDKAHEGVTTLEEVWRLTAEDVLTSCPFSRLGIHLFPSETLWLSHFPTGSKANPARPAAKTRREPVRGSRRPPPPPPRRRPAPPPSAVRTVIAQLRATRQPALARAAPARVRCARATAGQRARSPAAAVGQVSPVIPAARGKIAFGSAAAAAPTRRCPAPAARRAAPDVDRQPGNRRFPRPPAAGFLQPGSFDRQKKVEFRASELYSDLAKGRASRPGLGHLPEVPGNLLPRPSATTEDVEVAAAAAEARRADGRGAAAPAPIRSRRRTSARSRRPFLQVAMEDNARLPKAAGSAAGARCRRPVRALCRPGLPPARRCRRRPPARTAPGRFRRSRPSKPPPEPPAACSPPRPRDRRPDQSRQTAAFDRARLRRGRQDPAERPGHAQPHGPRHGASARRRAAAAPHRGTAAGRAQRIQPPLQLPATAGLAVASGGQEDGAHPDSADLAAPGRAERPPRARPPPRPRRAAAAAAARCRCAAGPSFRHLVRRRRRSRSARRPRRLRSGRVPQSVSPHAFPPPPSRRPRRRRPRSRPRRPTRPPAADDRKIELGLAAILRGLPCPRSTVEPTSVPDDVRITLPFALIEPQLSQGRVVRAAGRCSPRRCPKAHREVLAPTMRA